MKHRVALLFSLVSVLLSNLENVAANEGVLRKFVKVSRAELNTEKEKWGGDRVSAEQCAKECMSRPICASFEMEDTKCFLSEEDSSGVAAIIFNWKRDYYQRIRPNEEIIVLKKVTIPAEDHLGLIKGVDMKQCVEKCRETPLCQSFEFKEAAKKCDLSNVTHHTHDLHPSKWGWDIYIFNPDYKPIDCGKPPNTDYSSVSYDRTDYLANAEYTCETGEIYTAVCGEDSQWSHQGKACKKPVDCGDPPLLGYAAIDYNETGYKAKATYRCLMGESYLVECTKEGRWSSPNGRCRSPRSCKEFQSCGKNVPDGQYWIYPKILNGERVNVFCAGMKTDKPKEYITLKKENFALSSPLKAIGLFCLTRTVLGRGRPGKSIYTKVRLLPETMVLDIADYKYVSLIDGYGSFKHDFATAEDCLFKADNGCNNEGTFQVNLKGTGLTVDKSIQWKSYGYHSRVQSITRTDNNQNIRGVCGGTCGGCRPNGPLKVEVLYDDLPNTISAQFCQEM